MDFSQIAILLVVAAAFGIIARRFKQPLIIGYLLAGLILAHFGLLKETVVIQNLGKIGVALLLFLVGLEMNIRELPTVGKASLYTGLGQITFTFIIAMLLGILLGFSLVPAAYLAIAVSFSSTIIIVKLLSEKNDLGSLYGKISIGFLLVQDLVAIIILLFLAGLGTAGLGFFDYLLMAIKAIAMLGAVWYLSKKVLPTIFEKYIALSQELLFIVSIAWALGVASLVAGPLGFTLEIGGFLAGLALSNLPEHLEIASKTRPLRDFFLTIFFLSLGAGLLAEGLGKVIFPATLYSLLVLIGNPIIVLTLMGFLRFKRRTSFLASVTVAQISEFSLIVMAMGLSLGHVGESHVAMTVMVAAVTMIVSTYLVLEADKVYERIKDKLKIFERKSLHEMVFEKEEEFSDHVVLVGCYRTGFRLLSLLKKKKIPYVIVDFSPDVYKKLTAARHSVILGDIGDLEILKSAGVGRAKLVISTIDNVNDNMILLEFMRQLKRPPTSIFTSVTRQDAIRLYEKGASYVIVPDIVAGEHIRHLLRAHGFGGERLEKMGRNHFNRLIFV